jgi:lipopolysaccharide transport system permease protein
MDSPVPLHATTVRRPSLAFRLVELYRFRELIYNLTVRELKVRYKNSALGFFWSLLNPLGMMIVFTIVFTVMMPSYNIPKYPIFLLCGLLPWNFFSAGVMAGINSVVGNGNLVKKVYFPRETLPVSIATSSLVNFLLAMVVLAVVLIIFHSHISPWIWLLPFVILVQTCFILGITFFLSALNVFYRDTMMVMDVVMLAWFFLTPVFYPINVLPTSYEVAGIELNVHRLMYIVNPMASIIAAYRDLLYWGYQPAWDFYLRTTVTSLAVLVIGYLFFIRYSRRFGEEV